MNKNAALGLLLGLLWQPVFADDAERDNCDLALEREWRTNSGARESVLDLVARQPSADEKKELRETIGRCKADHTHFQFDDGYSSGELTISISVMLLAAALDEAEILDQLVADGHSADGLPNYFGTSTLSFAVWRQAPNSIAWALDEGIDPNLADIDGITALMYSAQRPQDQVESMKALIGAGANVNSRDENGWTPLAVSIRSRNFDGAAILFEAGADADIATDFLMETAKTTPAESARTEIRELVARFNAEIRNVDF